MQDITDELIYFYLLNKYKWLLIYQLELWAASKNKNRMQLWKTTKMKKTSTWLISLPIVRYTVINVTIDLYTSYKYLKRQSEILRRETTIQL